MVTHSLLHVGDEVVPVLGLLQTSKSHLGTGNVLKKSVPTPPETKYILTFLGFSRYSKRVWFPHSTPLLTLAAV